jgi:UDP-N-acetylmuramate--alanine ligase
MRFVAHSSGLPDLPIELNVPGEHNVLNCARRDRRRPRGRRRDDAIARALAEFRGVDRRFQRHGEIAVAGGAYVLIDDYGHHPVEMAATIAAARGSFPDGDSCSRFSRIASRERATCSKTSSRCFRPSTRWC